MALDAYISINGKKQGDYPAEIDREPHKGKKRAAVYRFEYGVLAPRDVQSHSQKGERTHTPVKIVKETGKMTPLIQMAATAGELLPKVEIAFYRNVKLDNSGTLGQELYFTVTLEDARVVSQRIFTGAKTSGDGASQGTSKHGSQLDSLELEEFELTFRKIIVRHEISKKEASDDWDESPVTMAT